MKFVKMNYNKERAEQLTQRLLETPHSPQSGVLMNDLLTEFHRGYPLDNLRPLLLSQNQDVASSGAWIASELGEKGKPLFDVISVLLKHPERRVRFSVIDCVLLWAGPSNKAELASVIRLMDDQEPSVRWKAMDFLARSEQEQLQAALSHMESTEPTSTNIQGLRWLLGPGASHSEEVMSALQGQDRLMRKYGVVAARRMAKNNREPLLYAASLDDPDVKDFADSSITLL
jgi:hypothetical protein